jgi:hypothetical protein
MDQSQAVPEAEPAEQRAAERPAEALWLIKAADRGLLAACLGAIAAVYILDAIFFAAWAPEWWLVPVFILIGLVIRTIAVTAGVVLQQVRGRDDIRVARTSVRVLWVACAVACLVPAMSFFAGGQKAQTQGGDVAAAVLEAGNTSRDSQIAELKSQIALLRDDRDKSVAEARKSIDAIKDEVDGMSAADNDSVQKLQDDISKYQADAAKAIAAKETEINSLGKQGQDAEQDTAREETRVSIFFAIFAVVDEVTGLDARGTSIATLFYFALLIEAIALVGLGAYLDLKRYLSQLGIYGALPPPARRTRQPFIRVPWMSQLPRMPWQKPAEPPREAPGGPPGSDSKPVDPPPADPPKTDPPGGDPRNNWNDNQWNGAKGADARDHYGQARNATKVRIPPVLTVDGAQTNDMAAEPEDTEETVT